MQLKKIQEQIGRYKNYLRSPKAYEQLYKWESLTIFQERWDNREEDFAKMYAESLQNSTTKRLWKREAYFPKQMMLEFIALEPDFVKTMFKDLLNENKSVDSRVNRFVFYCDELLQIYKRANPRSIENNHYHDYGIVSLYLAFAYPEKYSYYNFQAFQSCLKGLGAINIPQTDDIERFFKLCKTLQTFMNKDEEIARLHQKRLLPKHYQGNSMLLLNEFMEVLF